MTENLLVSLNDIEEKEASWLVPQRMPKGQIIILAGDGGSGKTSCWCSLAAAISTGAQVFFDETPKEFFESEPQKVLLKDWIGSRGIRRIKRSIQFWTVSHLHQSLLQISNQNCR